MDCKKILVPCKERITKNHHIRFSLVDTGIYPTQDVTAIVINPEARESIYYFLALLNSKPIFDWHLSMGALKGGILEFSEAPLNKIPIRRIDWDNKAEVSIHNSVTAICETIVNKKDNSLIPELELYLRKLIN
jgi:adenine-specific DNA-methyltransferase